MPRATVPRPDLSAGFPYRLDPIISSKLAKDEHRIVVTGAGGWLGQATLELLSQALGDSFPRRVVAFGATARDLHLRDGQSITLLPLSNLPHLGTAPTHCLHFACLTKDKASHMSVDQFQAESANLSATVFQALKRIGTTALFLPSSGAARIARQAADNSPMRLYGEAKLHDEARALEWADKNSRRAVIARIFNVSGPYINKPEDYALAAFLRDALQGRDVVVKAPHAVYRSSIAIREFMSVVFGLLGSDSRGVAAFDTAGEDRLEMRDLATLISRRYGTGKIEAAPPDQALPVDDYCGDFNAYRTARSLTKVSPVSLETQLDETAVDIRKRWCARQDSNLWPPD